MNKEKRRGIFVKLTRERSREDIRKLRVKKQKEGKDITEKERHEIIMKNARRAKIKTIIYVIAASGFISGMKTANLLSERNERNKTEINVDAEQYTKSIDIDNLKKDKNNLFVNGLKVDLEEIDLNEQIERSAREEVNNLKNSNEVLMYIKQIYADEFNERNPQGEEKVTANNIFLGKTRTADNPRGIMYANVYHSDGETWESESIIWSISSYKNDKEVEQDKESVLVDIGGIIENGIDYYSGFVDEDESDIYKNRLINSVIEYKKSKIKKITQRPTNEKTSDGYDIEQ